MQSVKILGSGCSKCKALERKINDLQRDKNLDIVIQKVTQLNNIMAYGVMITPGLVIDDKLVSAGRVPGDLEILSWLTIHGK